MRLAIIRLLCHTIHRLENLLYQQPVGVQHRVQQGHALCVSQGYALIQTRRGYLHQQLGRLVFIGQIKIMTHDGLHDKRPVQVVGSRNGSSGHQYILLATDADLLRLFVAPSIGIERTCLHIDAHLRIGTHIYGTRDQRLQKLDVKAKLVLVSPARCVVQIQMKLAYVSLTFRQSASKEFSTAHNLHAAARTTQKTKHRFWHLLCQLPDFHRLFVGRQVVHLQYYKPAVGHHPPLALQHSVVSSKADARQTDTSHPVGHYLPVGLPVDAHQVIQLTKPRYRMFHRALFDGCGYCAHLHTVNHFLFPIFFQKSYLHNTKLQDEYFKIYSLSKVPQRY